MDVLLSHTHPPANNSFHLVTAVALHLFPHSLCWAHIQSTCTCTSCSALYGWYIFLECMKWCIYTCWDICIHYFPMPVSMSYTWLRELVGKMQSSWCAQIHVLYGLWIYEHYSACRSRQLQWKRPVSTPQVTRDLWCNQLGTRLLLLVQHTCHMSYYVYILQWLYLLVPSLVPRLSASAHGWPLITQELKNRS